MVTFRDDSAEDQNIEGTLSGIDPACVGVQSGDGNRCGVHVHAGTSCSEDALGHYFSTGSDPWVPVTYTNAESGDATFSHSRIATGHTFDEMDDKVIVVHDSNGARIACSTLSRQAPVSLVADDFVKYFDYTG